MGILALMVSKITSDLLSDCLALVNANTQYYMIDGRSTVDHVINRLNQRNLAPMVPALLMRRRTQRKIKLVRPYF